MRWAKSYSIIGQEILQSGYLHRFCHESMILYLFLVVVGDRAWRSVYAGTTVMDILRPGRKELESARSQLINEGLMALLVGMRYSGEEVSWRR